MQTDFLGNLGIDAGLSDCIIIYDTDFAVHSINQCQHEIQQIKKKLFNVYERKRRKES